MAAPATSETIEIRRRGRQRLIGAVAIVVLLVVFVPMFLDSEMHPPAPDTPPMGIPSRDNAPPLPAPKTASAKPPEPPAKVTAVAPSAPSKAPVQAASAPRLEGFAVQVGAFRDEQTLEQARAKLAAAGVSHYTEHLGTSGLTRLRAGPFPTREAAEKALATLKRASVDGQVVPLP